MLREAPRDQRRATIMTAIEQGDRVVLHAVLSARPELSGMGPAEHAELETLATRKLNPTALQVDESLRLATIHTNLAARRYANTIREYGIQPPAWATRTGFATLDETPGEAAA